MKSRIVHGINSLLVSIITISVVSFGQEYTDYANDHVQDSLYQDYARKQQEKVEGGAAGGGGVGAAKYVLGGAAGYFLGGKVHSTRAVKKLKKKHLKEQKDLYTQYYNDVYKLQEQNIELQYVVAQLQETLKQVKEEIELEKIQRDYEEFKQPDLDGDERISRAEFSMYVNTYLKNYPGLAEKDYPNFEDFDHDHDGYVSFAEYEKQMKRQLAKAEQETKYAASSTGPSSSKTNKAKSKLDGLQGLYGETRKAENFNDLYDNYKLKYWDVLRSVC